MTDTEMKYRFGDQYADALRFASGATGSILDSDLPPGFERGSATSDPVCNQVDILCSAFDHVYGVVVVQMSIDYPLLPTPLPLGPAYDVLAGPAEKVYVPIVSETPTVVTPPFTPDLVEVAKRIRDLAGLSVGDVAAMVGIGRRQFYNLLDTGDTSPETELRMRHLGDLLEQLAAVAGEDPKMLRSALLTPAGPEAKSLYEAALVGDETKLRETFDSLLERIDRRGVRQVSRAMPRRGSRGAGGPRGERALEALDELPPIDLDPEVEGGGD